MLRQGLFRCCLLGACLFLVGCISLYPADKIDPSGDMTRKSYLALRKRGNPPPKAEDDSPQIPDLPGDTDNTGEEKPKEAAPVAPAPPLPAAPAPKKEKVGVATLPASFANKKVSVTVTDSVPLRDVLIELGREGGVNLEIDPRISGGVIFTAREQPFDLVLRRLCNLAGLRYRPEGEFVRVEVDEPYQQTYTLDYLSLARKASSEIAVATNVFDVDVTAGGNGSGGTTTRNSISGDNNSVSKISGLAEADFWQEVEKSLPQVMATAARNRPLVSGERGSKDIPAANFSLDKQSGLITVFGNSQQQEAVAKYLMKVQRKASAQVLIEARIVEVELNDQFQSGVNWTALFKNSPGLVANFAAPSIASASSGFFTASLDTKDFNGILNLVRTFGTTRVLSSPRLTVLNNQTAVLKVARNEVYFLTSAQFPTTMSASGVAVNGNPVFSSTPHTVPVGLVMTVQPAINSETSRVTMTLRPTISRVVDRVADPSIGLNAAAAGISNPVTSTIPVLAVREMDSVLQLQSGEVAVMGGLMQDSSENQDQGVPPFDALPIIGNLAKSRDNQGATSELVILLRATIMENPLPDSADVELYQKFSRDPRPMTPPPSDATTEKR